jgi:hypothetical protein
VEIACAPTPAISDAAAQMISLPEIPLIPELPLAQQIDLAPDALAAFEVFPVFAVVDRSLPAPAPIGRCRRDRRFPQSSILCRKPLVVRRWKDERNQRDMQACLSYAENS